jgi:DinB superfamily
MNQQLENIIHNLTENYGGMPWHGNSLKELLKDVDTKSAFFRPFEGKHTIAELVAHLLVWRQFAVEILNKNYAFKIDIGALADFPKLTENEKVWRELLILLDENQAELIAQLTQFNSTKLDDEIPQKHFTYRFLFDGIVHHDVYHSGQIGLIKSVFNTSSSIKEEIVKKLTFI